MIQQGYRWLSFFLPVIAPLVASSGSLAQNARPLTDMVLVNRPEHPFYIDIFETTGAAVNQVLRTQLEMDDASKPALMSFDQARTYCTEIGKRLPSVEEWMWAATNLHHNQHYTLVNDVLWDRQNRLRANINGAFGAISLAPTDLRNGIDAIGTVGMTGNRGEWAYGPDSQRSPFMCGRQFETEDSDQVDFADHELCTDHTDEWGPMELGTSRCVVDPSPGQQFNFSSAVTPELQQVIANRPMTIAAPVTQPQPEPSSATPATHATPSTTPSSTIAPALPMPAQPRPVSAPRPLVSRQRVIQPARPPRQTRLPTPMGVSETTLPPELVGLIIGEDPYTRMGRGDANRLRSPFPQFTSNNQHPESSQ